jgi:hypothetical protein
MNAARPSADVRGAGDHAIARMVLEKTLAGLVRP